MSEENPAQFNEGECENMNEIDQPYRIDSLPESLTDITDVWGQFSNESDLSDVNTDLTIAGRVTRINEFGDFVFYDVQDSTGEIQVMCSIDDRSEFETDNYTDLVGAISTGDHIVVLGCPDISDTGELTINANTLSVSSKSLRSISTEWNQLDEQNQIENRTAALVSNSDLFETVQTRFEIQNEIRQILDRHGYMEVETPILQGQAGGANATPFQAFCEDLNRDLYLRIAPELYLKRLIVSGYTQIYEMSRCFRNESIDTTHNPEFTMLELYEQYADYTDMMDLFETICEQTAESVLGQTDVEYDGYSVDLSSWNRIAFDSYVADTLEYDSVESVTDQELISYLEDSNRSVENLQELHTDELLLEVFECIESDIREPTIIYDFPRISTPLCQTHPTKQDRVERFEAFVMGMEVANAYSELTNPVEQLQRLTDQVGDDNIDSLNTNFVEALSYGMPPTGGLGVGIERLSMILTDSQSIKDVIPYPLTANRV